MAAWPLEGTGPATVPPWAWLPRDRQSWQLAQGWEGKMPRVAWAEKGVLSSPTQTWAGVSPVQVDSGDRDLPGAPRWPQLQLLES